jgi:hypothetical protein
MVADDLILRIIRRKSLSQQGLSYFETPLNEATFGIVLQSNPAIFAKILLSLPSYHQVLQRIKEAGHI